MIDSTNAVIADEPAHRLMISPTEITSVWLLFRMTSTVLPTRLSATSSLKIVCRKTLTCARMSPVVLGPISLATMPDRPSSASSSGAVDSALQKAACELIPNSESPHDLASVRKMIFRQRLRTGPLAVGTGPVPGRVPGFGVGQPGGPPGIDPGRRALWFGEWPVEPDSLVRAAVDL